MRTSHYASLHGIHARRQECHRSIRAGFGKPGSLAGNYPSNLKMAGGGMLFDSAIHVLDILLFLASAKRQSIDHIDMIMDKEFAFHTETRLKLELPTGSKIDASLTASCFEETTNQIELRFEHTDLTYSVYALTGRIEVRPKARDEMYLLSKG